jgi:hypothetical protein
LWRRFFRNGGDNKLKNHRFQAILLAVLLLGSAAAVLYLATRGSVAFVPDEMSKEEATTLLMSHEMFSELQTIKLNTGTIPARLSEVEHYEPKYTMFKSMGLIELSSIQMDSQDKDAAGRSEGTRVSLTEKGLTESKGWKEDRKDEWTITIATRRVVEVLSIPKLDERIQGIEFSWTWAANKTGEALKFSYQTERAYAKLERFEKGWRIVKIRAL